MDIIRIENSTITVADTINREMHVIKIQTDPMEAIQETEEMRVIEATQETVEMQIIEATQEIQIIELNQETEEIHQEQTVQTTIDLLGI